MLLKVLAGMRSEWLTPDTIWDDARGHMGAQFRPLPWAELRLYQLWKLNGFYFLEIAEALKVILVLEHLWKSVRVSFIFPSPHRPCWGHRPHPWVSTSGFSISWVLRTKSGKRYVTHSTTLRFRDSCASLKWLSNAVQGKTGVPILRQTPSASGFYKKTVQAGTSQSPTVSLCSLSLGVSALTHDLQGNSVFPLFPAV